MYLLLQDPKPGRPDTEGTPCVNRGEQGLNCIPLHAISNKLLSVLFLLQGPLGAQQSLRLILKGREVPARAGSQGIRAPGAAPPGAGGEGIVGAPPRARAGRHCEGLGGFLQEDSGLERVRADCAPRHVAPDSGLLPVLPHRGPPPACASAPAAVP